LSILGWLGLGLVHPHPPNEVHWEVLQTHILPFKLIFTKQPFRTIITIIIIIIILRVAWKTLLHSSSQDIRSLYVDHYEWIVGRTVLSTWYGRSTLTTVR